MSKWCKLAIASVFEYDTPKIVHINSKKVGVINRLIQLVIIGYVVGYVIVLNKGYQEFDSPISSVTTKVKGVAFTNTTIPGIGQRIWDVADYVEPPEENGAFFVTTNAIVTPNQTQSTCPEDPKVFGATCKSDSDCPKGKPIMLGNGACTGKCVDTVPPSKVKTCEIYAWCPIERDVLPSKTKAMINITDFTVLIKNNIEFPVFKVKRRNIFIYNTTLLQSCRNDPNNEFNKTCPVFGLGDVVRYAGSDIDQLSIKGGIVAIVIRWDCNLDHGIDACIPEYEFRRIDDPNQQFAGGWNFRHAYHYADQNGVDYRTLVKAYGIKFIILVKGKAGRFNFIPLAMNFGSGLALLALATVFCDVLILYCLPKREYYKEKKYLNVAGDDAFLVSGEENHLQYSGDHDKLLRDRAATSS